MKRTINEKVVKVAEYYVKNNSTVRQTAKALGISKSSVHIYLKDKLKDIDLNLYLKANKVLAVNKENGHMKGGLATKERYEKLKSKK